MKRGHNYFVVERPRIEIIPMIDIMMFLLIFFMVIALKMIAGSGIKMDLPGSSTAQELPATKLTIGVRENGTLYMDSATPITEEQLRQRLVAAKQVSTVEVVIAGDKTVSLQLLLKVMDIIRAEGISAVGIATKADVAAAP